MIASFSYLIRIPPGHPRRKPLKFGSISCLSTFLPLVFCPCYAILQISHAYIHPIHSPTRSSRTMTSSSKTQQSSLVSNQLSPTTNQIETLPPICEIILQTPTFRDSSVGIATRHGLDGPGIESQWGARFSTPVQTGPGAHPASYTMGTGSLPGVKRPGRGVDHPPPI